MGRTRLKEPSSAKVDESVKALVEGAACLVYEDHRGEVQPAEHVMLTTVYLQRALDALGDRAEAKKLVTKAVGR